MKGYLKYYKNTVTLAVPVMIAQAGQMVVQFADNIMVGHLGTTELAGVSFAGNIILIGFVFFICFSHGATPFIGQSFGKGADSEVRKWLDHSFYLNIVVGLLAIGIMALVIPFMDNMGQDPAILGYAKEYYLISLASIVPALFFFTIKNFSDGIGITKYAMYVTLFTNLLNVFLNWLLIYGKWGFPQMGVAGAATATLISRALCYMIFAYIVAKLPVYTRFTREQKRSKLEWRAFRQLFITSLPIGFQGLFEMTSFGICAIMAGWISKEAIAGYQVTNMMCTLSFLIAEGLGVAATINVSHNYGQGNVPAARKSGFAATHLAILFMGIAGVLYIIFRNEIPYIFTEDPTVVEYAAGMLVIAALFQVFDATQMAGFASLRGLKDVNRPFLYSFTAYYIIGLPAAYLVCFTMGMGANGIWVGLALGLFTVAVLSQIRFAKLTRL